MILKLEVVERLEDWVDYTLYCRLWGGGQSSFPLFKFQLSLLKDYFQLLQCLLAIIRHFFFLELEHLNELLFSQAAR